MKFTLFSRPLAELKTDLAVVVVDPDTTLAKVDDSELGRVLKAAVKRFKEERLKRELFHNFGDKAPVKNLVVFSSSLSKSYNIWENVKIFAARSLGYARDYGLGRVAFVLNHADGAPFVGKAAEGYILGGYRFDKYKKNKSDEKEPAIQIVVRPEDLTVSRHRLKRYTTVSEEVNRCRDVVNEPGCAVYPDSLAKLARKAASQGRLGCTILKETQLVRQGYRGLVEVGKGSVRPPRMIILRYKPPRRSSHHLALVGKGITFDTGGISLKPSEGMPAMKGDMAGGAAVIYAMAAIAQVKPSVQVTGIVAAAENFPGPRAMRPGDIFIAKNGKSITVDNTDAEGRLVLTDALYRAGEEKATHIVDIATLTGACLRALGSAVAGVMGNSPGLIQAVIGSGRNHGETYWELPLIEEYKEMLKTPYADINNIGGKFAGAITAGLFLREFVPEGTAWAHLDIAGPFMVEKKWKYYTEGASGFGLKTFVDLAERFEECI
jgi:leucyl aminopeptidase